jgi:hypothetical protein
MGGLGSGRRKSGNYKTLDSALAIDVGYLAARKWLRPGSSGSYLCSLGSGPNSKIILISLRAGTDHLHLSWRFANTGNNRSSIGASIGPSGEQEDAIVIPIARARHGACPRRPYFVCPGDPRKKEESRRSADDAAAEADDADAADASADAEVAADASAGAEAEVAPAKERGLKPAEAVKTGATESHRSCEARIETSSADATGAAAEAAGTSAGAATSSAEATGTDAAEADAETDAEAEAAGTSTDKASADGASTDGASTAGTSTDKASAAGTDNARADGASTAGTSTDNARADGASTDKASADTATADDTSAGKLCGRRVTKLYLSNGRFLCRHCCHLVYAYDYERPWQRASRRARKLRQRLDITRAGVMEKTKNMTISVYAKQLDAVLEAEIKAIEAGTAQILRIAGQLERRRKTQFTL